MLLLDDFFPYWDGIYNDYDGAYGDQCFDLANGYSRWIGGPRFGGATADLIFQQPGTFYTAVPNTPDNFPVRGDLVVWNWPHVGVANGNNTDVNGFDALEQNDPAGSNCHIKHYSYDGVIGWLHPKSLPVDTCPADRDTNWNMNITIFNALGVLLDPNDKKGSVDTAVREILRLQKITSAPPPVMPSPPSVVPVEGTTPPQPPLTPPQPPPVSIFTRIWQWIQKLLTS